MENSPIKLLVSGHAVEIPYAWALAAYNRDVPAHEQHAWGPSLQDLRHSVAGRFLRMKRDTLARVLQAIKIYAESDHVSHRGRGVVRALDSEAQEDVNALTRPLRAVRREISAGCSTRREASADRHEACIRPRMRADVKGALCIFLAITPDSVASAGAIQRKLTVDTHVLQAGKGVLTYVARGDSCNPPKPLIKRRRRGSKGGRRHRKPKQ